MATPETVPVMDLGQLFEQFASQSQAEQQVLGTVDTASADLAKSTDEEIRNIIKEGSLTGDIQSAVDQILIDRAQRNKESAAFFGVNPEASNSIIQAMAQDLVARSGELKVSGEAIAKKQSVGFMQDPFGWLINQFQLPFDVEQHQTKQAIFDSQAEALQKLGKLADEQIARNNAIDANTTAALSKLVAERALAKAQITAEDAKQKALQMGVQFGSVRLAATQQQFSNAIQLHNAAIAVQQLQLSRSTKELNEAMKKLQEKNLQLLIEAKEEDAASKKLLQENLDRATGILGMRHITHQEYKQLPQNVQRSLFDVMSNPSIQQGRLGYDAVDAMETANNLNAPLTPATTEVKNKVNTWLAEFSANPLTAALKPGERHTKGQEFVMAKLKAEANNIPDSGGLYSAASMHSLGKIPAVANTILWKSTFAPQAAAQRTAPLKAQAVYDAALGLVLDNKMDLERAAGEIAIIYKSVTMDNNENRNYNRFALPMQNNYRTHINPGHGALFSSGKIVDMSNPTEVKNNLLRAIAATKLQTTGTGSLP